MTLNALAVRGTADQMALAEWMFNALDKAAPQPNQHTTSAEYLVPEGPGNRSPVVVILYLAHADTPQSLQEFVNLIRATGDFARAFPNNALKAVTVRGTADQMALARWLFDGLDQPAQSPSTQEFRVAGSSNDVARVFYLNHTAAPQGMQEFTAPIRTTANMQRVFPYLPPKALAIRGTPDQLALAARLIQEQDQ